MDDFLGRRHNPGMQPNLSQDHAPPVLFDAHLKNPRLFASRTDMLAGLNLPTGGVVAEIGVAYGAFSEVIHNVLKPSTFVAFDLFNMHEAPSHWGIPSTTLFENKTHLDFFRDKFADRPCKSVLEVGYTHDRLPSYPDSYFDFIYIDAGHSYEEVKADAAHAARIAKPGAVLIFNDYTTFDAYSNVPYGVVCAVNELIVSTNWKVVGFALEPNMYCDIALQR